MYSVAIKWKTSHCEAGVENNTKQDNGKEGGAQYLISISSSAQVRLGFSVVLVNNVPATSAICQVRVGDEGSAERSAGRGPGPKISTSSPYSRQPGLIRWVSTRRPGAPHRTVGCSPHQPMPGYSPGFASTRLPFSYSPTTGRYRIRVRCSVAVTSMPLLSHAGLKLVRRTSTTLHHRTDPNQNKGRWSIKAAACVGKFNSNSAKNRSKA